MPLSLLNNAPVYYYLIIPRKNVKLIFIKKTQSTCAIQFTHTKAPDSLNAHSLQLWKQKISFLWFSYFLGCIYHHWPSTVQNNHQPKLAFVTLEWVIFLHMVSEHLDAQPSHFTSPIYKLLPNTDGLSWENCIKDFCTNFLSKWVSLAT